jgi:dihydroorotase
LEHLVHSGKIDITRLIEMFTVNPAQILSLPRGTLAAGAVADVTIFSTDRQWTYDVNKSLSKSRNSPFDSVSFRGGPVATIVSGKVVWQG